jgi:hypothetical protein
MMSSVNNKYIRLKLLMIFIGFTLTGCQLRASIEPAQHTETPYSSSTATPTLPSTRTGTPTFVRRDTPENTSTRTLQPTMRTPEPSRTRKERLEIVQNLFKDNGGCIDCFWGMVPRKTTLPEVDEYYRELGQPLYHLDDESVGWDYMLDSGMMGHFKLSYDSDTQIIDSIQGVIDGLNLDSVRKSDWLFFNLNNILKTYGAPSDIYFSLSVAHEPDADIRPVYSIVLIYERWDFALAYDFGHVTAAKASSVTICPNNDQLYYLHFWYGSKSRENSLLYYPNKAISEVSTTTINEFSTKFSSTGGQSCIRLDMAPFEPFP